jgi:hypothetical protein
MAGWRPRLLGLGVRFGMWGRALDAEEWIGLDQPERWDAALQGIPHGYWHRWTPCRVANVNTGAPVFLYVAHGPTGKVVCPLMEREWRSSGDFTTPIGFSGLAASTGALPVSFPERWAASLRRKGAVCVYLAQHPLYAPVWLKDEKSEESVAGTLFLLDLTRPPQQWLHGIDENRRRSIRSWERAGNRWVRDRALLTEFVVEHHAGFMRSVGASAASFYSDAALRLLCGDPWVELVGALDNQGIHTAAGFGSTPWGAELLFHISVRDGRIHTAALMWWAVRYYYGSVPLINLGGTPRENDTLAAAKRRYRPRELPFRRLKQVLDQSLYEKFCAEARVAADDFSGYFPAYRRHGLDRVDASQPFRQCGTANDRG